ncbi:GNAT family N-acetyltransferase [Thalassospira lucentensis]|uniref:GNAT family N-acetyltransferase n=1 Tax=Thalassospira lucentensis TaxID=168935 RepID=UPI0003B321FC|nr:GNAT family N-acetyltransferase [Thalassospira lucentensis]RCK28671.1 molybdopterin-guanine dinucleotide biosynthesis protein MobC [Thalassospira lucentensis MCCC 1A00383 = DSM 14000]
MQHQGFTLQPGIADKHREAACALFWEAFRQKLARVMNPEDKALAFLKQVMASSHAISAIGEDGRLLGVAGFKTTAGAFVGGGVSDICSVYGAWGGLWRGLLLDLLERDLAPDMLLMDGIFVDPIARGQGVGTALLAAVADTARERGLSQVRLDVIDINPRARALYERCGFRATGTQDIGPLRYLFGFRAATTMHRDIGRAAP